LITRIETMATVLEFPRGHLSERALDHLQSGLTGAPLLQSLLTGVRRDIRQSLLLLDLAMFQLRRAMPEQMSRRFAQEIASIEALLAAARLAAQQI
jgi:hypothetical protein